MLLLSTQDFKNVCLDILYSLLNILELYEFTEEENGSTLKGIYWTVNFPFPLSNRDVSSLYVVFCC